MEVKVVNKSSFDLPEYATVHSAGLDLRANTTDNLVLAPLDRVIIPTGLFIEIPVGFEAQIRPRSGMAIKHGITVINSPGTIDADYRGEIKVGLVNISNEAYTIKPGERIAQMVFSKHETVSWLEVELLSETDRGEGGFGHTGKK
ncbi:dUTP diphosphatase [Acetobacteroides hydrogenigenes]|uniref:Deoxyuridine 5'-triphosphate nucleotidohydrolase n=1 Tax=Acetobacteroides hydrogenigenes TaxID=979970 RepID=A0A4R2EUA7_9BACT|nr:dUTP diphosphatase [Acetobacteroides hydrogenigenes]TCN72157.1 dUTP pyrophosphatase [Acetobacteroides hydrogenigenes]